MKLLLRIQRITKKYKFYPYHSPLHQQLAVTKILEFFGALDHQQRWPVEVRGGIFGTQVVGLHSFDGHLYGDMFHGFIEICQKRRMQLDWAPAHFHRRARNNHSEQLPQNCE